MAKAAKTTKEGYKGHRAGTSKEAVHKKFDEAGKDAAIKLAVKLELQESTARTWCSTWGGGKGVKTKKAAKAPAKKATAKKAAPAKKATAPKKKARVRSTPAPAEAMA